LSELHQNDDDVLKNALETTARCWEKFPHLTDTDFVTDFTQCLYWRYEGRPSEEAMNTYLKEFEIPQAFLYDILANRFPLLLGAQALLLSRIKETAAKHRHICLLDLGCGRGEQLVRILNALNEVTDLKSVTVIGTELQTVSLDFCASYVASVSHRFRYTLQFKPLAGALEDLTKEQVDALLPAEYGALLINASLVLHHVQQLEQRRRLFALLHSLKPALLTLVEPDTNCFTDDEEQRLLNAYEHFGSLYSYISTLPVNAAERKGLKQFFRNELYDTVVLPDSHRFEKYLPGDQWMELATAAGFSPSALPALTVLPEIHGIAATEMTTGYTRFSYKGSALLGVMALG
jgi:hypothetical protein